MGKGDAKVSENFTTGTLALPNMSEVSLTIPEGTERFRFKLRDSTKTLRYSTQENGTTGSDYVTLPAGAQWAEDTLYLAEDLTIYVRHTDVVAQVLETERWI